MKASLKEIESKIRKKILEMLDDEMHDKEVTEDEIMVNDLAENIEGLLGMLKTYDIDYEIDPPYPHKIFEFKKEWTEEDIAALIAANPGLTVTAEEMNALN